MTSYIHTESPLGRLLLVADEAGMRAIEFDDAAHPVPRAAEWREHRTALLDGARRQLQDYFAGSRQGFDLPLAAQGTSFQLEVWRALAEIPFGETRSYAEIAQRLGQPGAVRAVGAANARNPLAIVVPCHRVIGANGSLTGYAGGLDRKRALLALEGARAGELFY
jgi:methylated-DNA-[protein]-cysteine S-methyltransferase